MKHLWIIFLLALVSCIPVLEKEKKEIDIDFSNQDVTTLYSYFAEGKIDSLNTIEGSDPTIPYIKSQIMNALGDKASLDMLYTLLNHENPQVRANAAFALGKVNKGVAEDSLMIAYSDRDTLGVVNPYILEAIAKITKKENRLKQIASAKNFENSDIQNILGQIRSIYAFALRKQYDPFAVNLLFSYLEDEAMDREARILAAYSISRQSKSLISSNKERILGNITLIEDEEIRYPLMVALSKIDGVKWNEVETLWSPKLNAIEQVAWVQLMKMQDQDSVHLFIEKNWESFSKYSGYLMAQYLASYPNQKHTRQYLIWESNESDPYIKALLINAVFQGTPRRYGLTRARCLRETRKGIESSESPYVRALYIKALANEPTAYNEIIALREKFSHPVEKNACYEALKKLIKTEDFDKVYRSKRTRSQVFQQISEFAMKGFEGKIGEKVNAAYLLQDSLFVLEDSTLTFIKDSVMKKLDLPQEYEAAYEMVNLLKSKGMESKLPELDAYYEPLDEPELSRIRDSTIATIKTNKGRIDIQFYPKEAPLTVSRFIKSVEEDYYDGKYIHRFVPGFVVQTGCSEGDGYSSRKYVNHTEIAKELRYDRAGYLGMASMGPNTESAQWFITLRSTPHLDGKYTIFARVLRGMDIVYSLEQGDVIQDITLFNIID